MKIFHTENNSEKPLYIKIVNIGLLVLLILFVLILSYYMITSKNLLPEESVLEKFFENLNKISKYKKAILEGYKLTAKLSIFGLLLSLVFGALGGLFQRSRIQILHYIGKVYVEIIRGTPLLVQIIAFYYFVGAAFNFNNKFWSGVIILAIFEGAYIAEIIRGGIESISNTQIETARSLSFTKFQTYIYIIFPQVIRRILPSLTGQFASLVKDSSLLSIIALSEYTLVLQNIGSNQFTYTEVYMFMAIGYLLITFPISMISKKLERKFTYEA